jgi:hypothetical protein
MGEMTNTYRIFVGMPESKRPLGRAIHEGIILKLILNNYCVSFWTGLIRLIMGPSIGLY